MLNLFLSATSVRSFRGSSPLLGVVALLKSMQSTSSDPNIYLSELGHISQYHSRCAIMISLYGNSVYLEAILLLV